MLKTTVLSALLLLVAIFSFAQVGINTDGSQPDSSAGLDVKFSNKGFLPPRIALIATNIAYPIVSPSTGLLIYNTATAGNPPNNIIPGYYYWNGMKWSSLAGEAVDTSCFAKYDSLCMYIRNDFDGMYAIPTNHLREGTFCFIKNDRLWQFKIPAGACMDITL